MTRREVTVVVPTRNREAVLGTTLRSVLHQEDVDVRVVVVDEASTDGTLAMVERLRDDRIEVARHDEPQGVATARNTGLARVATPWVAFCDDDDVWAPDKLTVQLAALDAGEARWCCGGSVLVDADLHVVDHQPAVDGEVLDDMLGMNVIAGGGSGVLAETALVREVGGFDGRLKNSEDWDLWIRLAAASPVAGVDRPLVGYRIWAASKSRNLARMELAWSTITERYRDLAAERGVHPDRWRHQAYLARQQVRSGKRVVAARTYAKVALGTGSPRNWARAAAALSVPAVMDRVGTARAAKAVPVGWRDEAETWLRDLRRPRAGSPA
jgi:glycosyltransferase involved in cell wall biosynthesis